MIKRITTLIVFLTFSFITPGLLAQNPVQEKATKLPCILAGSGLISYGDFAQKRPNCTNIFLEPLVGASVSKLDDRHWNLNVESHLKRGIQLTLEIESYSAGREHLGSETVRIPLNPKEKAERKLSVRNRTSGVVAVLKSYTLKEARG